MAQNSLSTDHLSARFTKFASRNYIKWLLLAAYTLFIFCININSDGIYAAQESRAAIIAKNMLKSGNYLSVSIKGAPETEKPIMCYWFYAASCKIFGINELGIRVPSVLAALVSVLLACWLGGRIYDPRTGFMAGYLLASMIGFINLGRIARIDIVLCAFFALSMVLLYKGYFEQRRANAWLYLFYLVLALSVLVKGPVSVILAALIVLAMAVKEKNWKMLWELKPVSGLIIGVVISVPWYVYESIRTNGEFAFDFFWNQNIDRFLGINTAYCGGRRKTFFYYFPKLFAGALPWSILVPFCLYSFRRKLLKLKPATYFLVFWVTMIFLFFSFSAIKRGDYVLPLYPALAILLGRYLISLEELKARLSVKWVYGWILLLVAAFFLIVSCKAGLFSMFGKMTMAGKIPHLSFRDGMSMVQISDIFNAHFTVMLILTALIFAVLYFLGLQLEKGRQRPAVYAFLLIFMMVIGVFYLWIDPAADRFKTTKYFALKCQTRIPADAVVCYYTDWWVEEAVFYIGREYERGYRPEDIYDRTTGKLKYDYIICSEENYRKLDPVIAARFMPTEKTIEEHQYPSVLYIKKNSNF